MNITLNSGNLVHFTMDCYYLLGFIDEINKIFHKLKLTLGLVITGWYLPIRFPRDYILLNSPLHTHGIIC